MNRSILLTLLFTGLAASPVLAQTNSAHQACKDISHLAKELMKLRQVGAPMSQVMELTSSGSSIDEMSKLFVQRAYRLPQYSTEQSRERAVREFENEAYRECYEANSKGTRG
ncbi:hypothetical protein FXN63_01565 [Pigmentiphaga aceris]|uniref:Uncharacterized protein n=1 Tax=Pigmentiphaga aceris TaxID=1940612 RepID=A0A5C0ARC7_9BURK|nr:hypothetical protein [Pigmentiphaga aceris]QEI04672.1 hypothetical protein FXN63_01565 [Pigmentiphaga aceris]